MAQVLAICCQATHHLLSIIARAQQPSECILEYCVFLCCTVLTALTATNTPVGDCSQSVEGLVCDVMCVLKAWFDVHPKRSIKGKTVAFASYAQLMAWFE